MIFMGRALRACAIIVGIVAADVLDRWRTPDLPPPVDWSDGT